MSFDAFMCTGHIIAAPADPNAFTNIAPVFTGLEGGTIKTLGQGFEIRALRSGGPDVGVYRAGVLVGFYAGAVLAVDRAYAKMELGIALVLAAAPFRDAPTERKLSCPGYKTLRAAWEVANGERSHRWP